MTLNDNITKVTLKPSKLVMLQSIAKQYRIWKGQVIGTNLLKTEFSHPHKWRCEWPATDGVP